VVIGVSLVSMKSAEASPTYNASFSYVAPLARAAYVTDLGQTTAEVNWAESGPNASPGSVEWGADRQLHGQHQTGDKQVAGFPARRG
jgi:hypothetical protein